jgi:hypothetical protein
LGVVYGAVEKVIGISSGLAISSDACKGLASAVASVFLDVEHKEYMKHLMENFKKKFHDDVFDTEM